MRSLFMVVLLLCGSAAMAQFLDSRSASKAEIELICEAINTGLKKEQSGEVVDMETCRNTEMKTDIYANHIYVIKGELKFIDDAGAVSKSLCFAQYQSEPKPEKLYDQPSCD